MIAAREALRRLQEGNRRFVSGERRFHRMDPMERSQLVAGQRPFAVVLGCSDSRVPVELVFDQGLGDLFVIRVAGNVVASSQIDSVEYAAERFGIRLVVVLGHSRCGAIEAALNELRRPSDDQSPNLLSIVSRIQPAVQHLVASQSDYAESELVAMAVRANVRAAAEAIRHGSGVLERLTREQGILVVGAEYALETGVVEFFDGLPTPG